MKSETTVGSTNELIIDTEHLNQIKIQLEYRIAEKLNKAGIYYRTYSRVKSLKSLRDKLASGKYRVDGNKIQDIVGIRVNLFYYEDLNICEQILMDTFCLDNWSKSSNTENTFHAQKRNGVFRLPAKYLVDVDEAMWQLPIDQTFEVQIRTVLFEGWHEIEHDMRYKDTKNNRPCIWEGHAKLSRLMNSVIANLELCDWTIIEIFNQIATAQMEEGNYELAMRSKYRMKMTEQPLSDKIRDLFQERPGLFEKLMKTKKQDLVYTLLQQEYATKLTPDRMVYMLNQSSICDEELNKISGGKYEFLNPRLPRLTELTPLCTHPVFYLDVQIDESVKQEQTLAESAQIIYGWMRSHMASIFQELPHEVKSVEFVQPGYSVSVQFDLAREKFYLHMEHISNNTVGELWDCNAEIERKNGKLMLSVRNVCKSVNHDTHEYTRPYFVRELLGEVGLLDADISLYTDVKDKGMVETFQTKEELLSVAWAEERHLPLIIIGEMEEFPEWAENTDQSVIRGRSLARVLQGIAHVKQMSPTCTEEMEKQFQMPKGYLVGGVCVFWPGMKTPEVHTLEEIRVSTFDENTRAGEEQTEYEKSFRQRLAAEVKRKNLECL